MSIHESLLNVNDIGSLHYRSTANDVVGDEEVGVSLVHENSTANASAAVFAQRQKHLEAGDKQLVDVIKVGSTLGWVRHDDFRKNLAPSTFHVPMI